MSKIRLTLIEKEGCRKITINFRKLYCGGFTGRNQASVKQHIDEMISEGIIPPEKTPILYHISPYLLTSCDELEVVGDKTSGEVEPVLIISSEEKYLTVGSDHTDREIEKFSYSKSKQICQKIIAKQVWRYNEVKDHYDDLVIRSEVEKDGNKYLYQEGSVSIVMNPFDLIRINDINESKGLILFSGTIPTHTKRLIYGDLYRIELIDPFLDRRIVHSYRVKMI